MSPRYETTDHEETETRSNAPKWIILAGTAAALGAGGYVAYRMLRKPSMKERLQDRVDTVIKVVKR